MINVSTYPGKGWLPAHTLAIAFSLGHMILDWDLNLFGPPSTVLTGTQALILILGVSVYALWASALVVASHGRRIVMAATIALGVVGGLGNGLSIVACPPPCSGAPPFGDITHIGSLVFGAWAIYESGRALVARSPARAADTGQHGVERKEREEFSR